MTNSFQISQLIREFRVADRDFTKAAVRRELIARHLGQASGIVTGAWSDESWNQVQAYIKEFEAKEQVGPICPPVPVAKH